MVKRKGSQRSGTDFLNNRVSLSIIKPDAKQLVLECTHRGSGKKVQVESIAIVRGSTLSE